MPVWTTGTNGQLYGYVLLLQETLRQCEIDKQAVRKELED